LVAGLLAELAAGAGEVLRAVLFLVTAFFVVDGVEGLAFAAVFLVTRLLSSAIVAFHL
jgi:hypothetical protein